MNCLQKKTHISMRFLVVAYSDKTIESIVEEMQKFSTLFESTKKAQEWAWGFLCFDKDNLSLNFAEIDCSSLRF